MCEAKHGNNVILATNQDLQDWAESNAQDDMGYLLAYADDGVIWGFVDANGRLQLAGSVFPEIDVPLRPRTLQQARLFGPAGELFLWRTEQGFCTRLIADGATKPTTALEDNFRLWGSGIETRDGFTMMEEGAQGLYHAPPVKIARDGQCYLKVRHYVQYDENTGQAYISHSRLVDLLEWR